MRKNLAIALFCWTASLCAQSPEAKPLIRVLATGGTIAHVREGYTPDTRISGQQLIKDIPQLAQFADIEVEEVAMVGSADLTPAIMLQMSKRANKIFSTEPRVAGIIVTIGSNSLEEMAYFLHLTVKSDKPVILTAAQRQHGSLGAEGDMNLLESVRVAVDPHARGMGVLAVVNDEIHSARDVRKTISHRMDTWNSGDLGDLGLVDHDRVTFYRKTLRKHTYQSEFDIANLAELPRVDIVYSYTGADGIAVDAAVKQGHAKGLVAAAFPTGAIAPEQVAALQRIAATGIPVVDSHRGGRGRPGNRYKEFIDADNLPPQHARLLLMLGLTKTSDPKILQRYFDEY
jgi:L-asparaginase